jgi:hypothetical protein
MKWAIAELSSWPGDRSDCGAEETLGGRERQRRDGSYPVKTFFPFFSEASPIKDGGVPIAAANNPESE